MSEEFNKKELSEREICTKYITPAIEKSGWDKISQIREEVTLTSGKNIVRRKTVKRCKDNIAKVLSMGNIQSVIADTSLDS